MGEVSQTYPIGRQQKRRPTRNMPHSGIFRPRSRRGSGGTLAEAGRERSPLVLEYRSGSSPFAVEVECEIHSIHHEIYDCRGMVAGLCV